MIKKIQKKNNSSLSMEDKQGWYAADHSSLLNAYLKATVLPSNLSFV